MRDYGYYRPWIAGLIKERLDTVKFIDESDNDGRPSIVMAKIILDGLECSQEEWEKHEKNLTSYIEDYLHANYRRVTDIDAKRKYTLMYYDKEVGPFNTVKDLLCYANESEEDDYDC